MHFSKKDLLTIPNILTYFRLILVPVFIILYFKLDTFPANLWTIACVAVSALTDVIDGKIARRTGQITDIGKILDPVADKLMEFAMMFCIALRYPLVIILFIVFALKELISLGFSGYLFKHDKNIGGAIWCGKLCTVILYAVLIIFLIFPDISMTFEIIMILVSLAAMILAFVIYIHAYVLLLKELKAEREASEENPTQENPIQ